MREGMEKQRNAVESDDRLSPSELSDLIIRLTKMSKNPSIECGLSEVLDEFLQRLNECDQYFKNGTYSMNFAEAALLIQSSVDLYSKKVDLLWDIIFDYHKRLLLCEQQDGNNSQEIEKLEERKRKYKRKRKINSDEKESSSLVNKFSFGRAEDCVDYLNQGFEATDLHKEWEMFHVQNKSDETIHTTDTNFTFLPTTSIYNEDNEYIGRYNQFHSMSLIDEIFHLEKQKLLTDDDNCVTEMRIDTELINEFLLEKSIPSDRPVESYLPELKKYISNFYETHRHKEKDVDSSSIYVPRDVIGYEHSLENALFNDKSDNPEKCSSSLASQTGCKESFVCVEKLPFNVLRDNLRRTSLADSLLDDTESCPSPSCCVDVPRDSETTETFDQCNKSLESRSKSCSQDSAFYEDEDPGSNEEVNANPDSVLNGPGTEADSGLNRTAHTAKSGETILTSNMGETDILTTETVTSNEISISSNQFSELCAGSPRAKRQRIPKRKFAIEGSCQEENPNEVKKRKVQRRASEKSLRKLTTGITVDYRHFEIFFRSQYNAANGEGVVPPGLSDSEDDDDEDNQSETTDDEQDDSFMHNDEEASDTERNDEMDPSRTDSCEHQEGTPNVSFVSDPSCSFQDIDVLGRTSTPHRSRSSRTTELPLLDADLLEEDQICRKNVREWRSFILPKIKALDKKQDFDIHEYGVKIIESSEIGEERQFKDIVKGRSSAEVTRYFVATLQLANTCNVKIIGGNSGEKCNDFKIQTLDKTRHHELLEEYQAPSEENLKEKYKKARDSISNVSKHSTDRKNPVKRLNFVRFIKKTV